MRVGLLYSGGHIVTDEDLQAAVAGSTQSHNPSDLNQLSLDTGMVHPHLMQQHHQDHYPSSVPVYPGVGGIRYASQTHHHNQFIQYPEAFSASYSSNTYSQNFVSTADDDGDLPIHIAVAKEQYEQVATLLQIMRRINLHPDTFNDLRQTPLHIAVVTGNLLIVRLLLSHRLSPCAPDRHGNTAVHLAAKCGTKECLNSLLEIQEAEDIINSHNYDGFSPMHLAVFRKDTNIIKALVCKNADVDAQDGTSGRSPLFHAVENGFEEVVETLLACGANVNLPNFGGVTPLVVATDRGNQTITSMLISRGAMMNCRDDL